MIHIPQPGPRYLSSTVNPALNSSSQSSQTNPLAMTRPIVQTVPASTPVEEIIKIIRQDGVIVVSDFVRSHPLSPSDQTRSNCFASILNGSADILCLSQIPLDEVDALNAKAKVHFERTEAEGRAADSFYKSGGRASNTTAAYDLLGSCPEEVSKL